MLGIRISLVRILFELVHNEKLLSCFFAPIKL